MKENSTDTNAVVSFDQGTAFRNHPLIASAHAAGENRNTFEAFVRGFIGDLQPVGTIEATLSARAAGIAWRLNRAQGLETRILSRPSDYSARKSLLQDGVGDKYTRQAMEFVSRWEQGLERSLFKTLDALAKMQRRRQRENPRNHPEDAACHVDAEANERETRRKEIQFDGELPEFPRGGE